MHAGQLEEEADAIVGSSVGQQSASIISGSYVDVDSQNRAERKRLKKEVKQSRQNLHKSSKELSKLKMREMFAQRMLDTAQVVNEFDQDTISKLKN